jgi:hypothetical protein
MNHPRLWTAAIIGTATLISGTVALHSTSNPAVSKPYRPTSITAQAQGIEGISTAKGKRLGQSSPTADPTATPTATPTPSPTPSNTPTPTPTAPPTPTPAPTSSGPWYGVLQATPGRAGQESAAGVTVGELELNWGAYEPSPGVFNASYAQQQRSNLAGLRSAGLQVVLDVGLQYPPSWVFGLDGNTRFVNQYGDVWHGGVSEDVANAVFDSNVRNAQAAYIAHVAADLGANNFYAVRAGGLLQDELRYPPATYNGHANSYWAFDAAALAHSPVPAWRPGQSGTSQASSFLNWYLQSLTDFQNWLIGTYRASFPAQWLQLLKPSWGLRPGDADAAINSLLNGSTPAASWGTLAMGLDWQRQVSSLTDLHVQLYGSWLERGDDGSTANTMAPAHYLATLGAARGIRTAGENATPTDDATTMSTIVQRVKSWGLLGLMWLDEPTLFNGTGASLSSYSTLIRS